MLNLASLNNLPLILVCVVPGFIIVSVRSQFLTGRSASHGTPLLVYVTVSFIYDAFAHPLISYFSLKPDFSFADLSFIDVIIWLALIAGVPAVIGLLFGRISVQGNWFHGLLQSWGFNKTLHPIETAWDWKFNPMQDRQWVIITLKDGTYFGGFCGTESFISSEPNERDLYIQQIYDIDDDGTWQLRKGTGVLVAGGQVSRIEFICPSSKESDQ